MNRRMKIVSELKKMTAGGDGAARPEGISAAEIGDYLGIGRSNASMELNELAREGLVVKYPGKPVRFAWLGKGPLSYGEVQTAQANRTVDITLDPAMEDPFTESLGWDSGLKIQVEQAKAAVLYPPTGLHTLLLGPTGSGKTFFARKMFEFAKQSCRGFIKGNAELVTFNCADYAHNPQLLLSQLFGYVKGSFSGANADSAGLVDSADGSVLFLDEIHRLPPEGQEMLFYLMDQGLYRRLGETAGQRHCRTLVIGATTESPQASLLSSFFRRFPVKIELPPLAEWSLADRMALLRKMLADESARFGLPIKISAECIRAFLLYDCPGNIGQLRNDLKLTCARAFLGLKVGSAATTGIVIKSNLLPPHVSVLATMRYLDTEELLAFFDEYAETGEAVEKVNWRQELIAEAAAFQISGQVSPADWAAFPRRFLQKHPDFSQVAPERLRLLRREMWGKADQHLLQVASEVLPGMADRRNSELLSVYLLVYLYYLAGEAGWQECRRFSGVVLPEHFLPERQLAGKIIKLMEGYCQSSPPAEEVFLLTLFLALFSPEERDTAVTGLAILAHGRGTASSVADTVAELTGGPRVAALDIPVVRDNDEIWLEKAEALVKAADQGQGVLLLVDMQPLALWGEIIARRTGVKLRVVDNLTTAIIVQAVREAPYARDPDTLAKRLITRQTEREQLVSVGELPTQVVAAACLTGTGTANCIKDLLEAWLQPYPGLEILTVDVGGVAGNAGERLASLHCQGRLAAVVGSLNPGFAGVPFISLEEILNGTGRSRLVDILKLPDTGAAVWKAPEIEHLLAQYLRFLDPRRMVGICGNILKQIETGTGKPLQSHQVINLTVHLSCLAERCLTGTNKSIWPHEKEIREAQPAIWAAVREAVKPLEDELAISVASAEIAFVVHYLTTV